MAVRVGDFASTQGSPYAEHIEHRVQTNVNFNAPLDSAGERGGWVQGHAVTRRQKAQGEGGGLLLCFRQRVQHGSLHQLGRLSLAARRERHGNLSLMSKLVYLWLIGTDKECRGWTACTEVTC